MRTALSPAGHAARIHDPDRFLCALFAPTQHREALFLLAAFNHELARAVAVGGGRSEAGPLASLIRLQWWREVVEGKPERHELAEPLGAALASGALDRGCLLAMIDAREREVEGVETLEAWRAVQLEGAGSMQLAAGRALGLEASHLFDRLRCVGAAYSAASMRRSVVGLTDRARRVLPPGDDALMTLLREGRAWLEEAGELDLGRACSAAVLVGVLAGCDFARKPDQGPRGLRDRLTLGLAWRRGGLQRQRLHRQVSPD